MWADLTHALGSVCAARDGRGIGFNPAGAISQSGRHIKNMVNCRIIRGNRVAPRTVWRSIMVKT